MTLITEPPADSDPDLSSPFLDVLPMAVKPTPDPLSAPPAETEPAALLTLDEFCVQLSTRVRSPTQIGGFHAAMRAARREVMTEAAWQTEFDQFLRA